MLVDRIHQPLFPQFATHSIATEHDAPQQVFSPSWVKGQAYNVAQNAGRTTWESFVDGAGQDSVSNAPAEPYSSGIKRKQAEACCGFCHSLFR